MVAFRNEWDENTGMSAITRQHLRWLTFVFLAIGATLLAIAIVYFVVPARDLPSFLGQETQTTAHRTRRGIAMLILAGVVWVLAAATIVAWRRRNRSIY
jgi:amino acid permease